ncbi:MAG: reverse transcriptase/maturase family protein [Bryobacteraceae bacterium]
MKRIGGLWDGLISYSNLSEAARRAALGKRSRRDVAAYLLNLENEIAVLRRELLEGSYQPGPYREFRIVDPKPRMISAAPFRDRVVHHALTQVLEPIFETRFSPNSYACRKGMGTRAALERAKQGAAVYGYALKADVRKYFASIDHEILMARLERTIKCKPTLDLAARIVAGSNAQEDIVAYFPGDDLFTPADRRRGLPLGNQTSQFFANLYLDALDQFVDRTLKPPCWVRYVDDILVFDASKERLREVKAAVEEKLAEVRLRLHEGKSRAYRCQDGVGFLGWLLFPGRTRLARRNVVGFRRRLGEMEHALTRRETDFKEVRRRVYSWIGHAAAGDTWRLRERLFEEFRVAVAKQAA